MQEPLYNVSIRSVCKIHASLPRRQKRKHQNHVKDLRETGMNILLNFED
jgi:hypothetical protein